MGELIFLRRRPAKLKKLLNRASTLNTNSKQETRTDILKTVWLNNSKLVDCWLVFLPDQDNVVVVMVTFLKVLNLNSTARRSTRENTDKHFDLPKKKKKIFFPPKKKKKKKKKKS